MDARDPRAASADIPWRSRADWAEGRIRGQTGSQAALLWLMAVLWNGFIWTVLWMLRDQPERSDMFKVALLFAALGLAILAAAVVTSFAWFRFGSSVLELATNPGVIGGTLEGRIHTRLAHRPRGPVQLTLSCVRQRLRRRHLNTGRGTGSTGYDLRSDLLWQGGRSLAPEDLERGHHFLSIPVKVHIPHGLPGTDDSAPEDRVAWTLSAAADIPGVDFSADFAVPVLVTDASDPELTEVRIDELMEGERGAVFAQPVDRGRCWKPPVVVQPTGGGGVRYTFRLAVTLKTALAVTGLALGVCAGSAALFVWLGRAGPFALVPGALGALLLLATVVIWTFVSRVDVEEGLLTVRKSVLGIPRSWRIPASDVTKVAVKREGEDWEIRIQRRSGPEVNLGATLPSRDDATRIAAEIERLVS